MQKGNATMNQPAGNKKPSSKRGYTLAGNTVVEAIGKMDFTGNIIPHPWFEHLRKKGKKADKPYTVAIILLSDIVYWYRPIEVRDEKTGRLLGWRKRFKSDKLQKDYGSLALQFGFTKKQVKDAIQFLKQQGVITTELRTVKTKSGQLLGNVMFIEPVVSRLAEITYSRLGVSPSIQGSLTLSTNLYGGLAQICTDPMDKFVPTLTEATTETTAQNTTPTSEPTPKSEKADQADGGVFLSLVQSFGIRGRKARETAQKAIEHGYSENDLRAIWQRARDRLPQYRTGWFIDVVTNGDWSVVRASRSHSGRKRLVTE